MSEAKIRALRLKAKADIKNEVKIIMLRVNDEVKA